MQVVTFETMLHGERVWAYLVRCNGMTFYNGYAPTQKIAEERAERYLKHLIPEQD